MTSQPAVQKHVHVSSLPHTAEPAIESKKSFLDTLSPELRNEIYRLCLVAPKSVHIAGETPKLGIVWYSTFDHTLDWQLVKFFTPGLLRCCKQIRDESISILYGENAFRFRNFVQAQRFLETFRVALLHLRYITVFSDDERQFDIERLFITLKRAPKLRRLTLSFHVTPDRWNTPGRGMKRYDAKKAAKVLGPLIRNLWRQRQRGDSSKNEVLGTIRWTAKNWHHFAPSPGTQEEAAQFEFEVIALLEKTLK
ncbi:unnamed protein product [Cercospora beticola]|nr:unnamed protein product [Cercospora beticola]